MNAERWLCASLIIAVIVVELVLVSKATYHVNGQFHGSELKSFLLFAALFALPPVFGLGRVLVHSSMDRAVAYFPLVAATLAGFAGSYFALQTQGHSIYLLMLLAATFQGALILTASFFRRRAI